MLLWRTFITCLRSSLHRTSHGISQLKYHSGNADGIGATCEAWEGSGILWAEILSHEHTWLFLGFFLFRCFPSLQNAESCLEVRSWENFTSLNTNNKYSKIIFKLEELLNHYYETISQDTWGRLPPELQKPRSLFSRHLIMQLLGCGSWLWGSFSVGWLVAPAGQEMKS